MSLTRTITTTKVLESGGASRHGQAGPQQPLIPLFPHDVLETVSHLLRDMVAKLYSTWHDAILQATTGSCVVACKLCMLVPAHNNAQSIKKSLSKKTGGALAPLAPPLIYIPDVPTWSGPWGSQLPGEV